MKFAKLYTVLAAAVSLAGLSSCSDVTEPKFQEPDAATFKVNVPPLQNEYYGLTEDGTFNLEVNGQPDYGFSAITQYRAEVSLTPEFTEFIEISPIGTGTQSKMTFKDSSLAMALCQLDGVEDEEGYVDMGIRPVYFRGVAFIEGVDKSFVRTSNVVSLNKVQGFFKLPVPGVIYCVGNYVGDWIGPTPDNADALEPYTLSERDDEIDSKKYYGTIDFQPTKVEEGCIFRFYTALGSWDENSYGCADGPDNDTPVEFPDFVAGSVLDHALAKTKDSFKLNNYTGKLDFFVDLSDSNNPKITITAVE